MYKPIKRFIHLNFILVGSIDMSTTPVLSANFSGLTNEISRVFSVMSGKTPVLYGPQGDIGATGPQGATGSTGPSGTQGIGIGTTVKGAWISGNTAGYNTNGGTSPDAVTYNGSFYICINDNTQSNVTPDQDSTNWLLYVSKGVTGPTGPQAVTGPTGFTGATGIGIGTTLQGNWSSGATYRSRSGVSADAVTYNGSLYVCIQATPFVSTIPPNQDTANWLLYVQMGATGATGLIGVTGPIGVGIGTTLQGTWSNTRSYSVNSGTNPDAVTYNGSLYVCQANVDATGPLATPDTDSIHWLLYVQKGATGPVGPQGASGTGSGGGSGDTFMVGGGSGLNKVAYTTDGLIWKVSSSGNSIFTFPCKTVAWNGTTWLAGGYNSNISTLTFNTTLSGRSVTNANTGVASGYSDNAAYSSSGYSSSAYMTFTPHQTNKSMACGFTTSPTGYFGTQSVSINIILSGFGFILNDDGTFTFVKPGGTGTQFIPSPNTYTTDSIFRVEFNSTTNKVTYKVDGMQVDDDAVTYTPGTPLSVEVVFTPTSGGGGIDNFFYGLVSSTLAYSSDGINWLGVNDFYGQYGAIAWNGSIWVAGGDQMAYSYDAINWFISSSGTSLITSVNTVAWSGLMWVAGGSSTNKIIYSRDGITWTSSATGTAIFSTLCSQIAWNGILWVGVGSVGTDQPAIGYSYDGITWSNFNPSPSPSISAYFSNYAIIQTNTVAWNRFYWLIGCQQYSSPHIPHHGLILKSSDGISWTPVGNATAFYNINTLAWNNSVWVAGGTVMPSGARGYMAYSYNSITWTEATSGSLIFNTSCLALASRRPLPFTGLDNSQVGLYYRASGPTGPTGGQTGPTGPWLQLSANIVPTQDATYDLGATGLQFKDIYFSGDLYQAGTKFVGGGGGGGGSGDAFLVAGGSFTNTLAYTNDGLTWNASSSGTSVLSGGCRGVAWNGSLWVAVGSGTFKVAYSSDGINWIGSASGTSAMGSVGRCVAWNGYLWVAGGGNIIYSSDGINWSIANSESNTACWCIAWNGTMWLAGRSTPSQYSYDGINWSPWYTNIFSSACTAIAWNGTMWIAGGDLLVTTWATLVSMAVSYDGLTWGPISMETAFIDGQVNTIAWNGSLWLAASDSLLQKKIGYSYDGLTWITSLSGTSILTGRCKSIAWNGSLWVAIGDTGPANVATSPDGITWTTSTSGSSVLGLGSSGTTYNWCVAARRPLPLVGLGNSQVGLHYRASGPTGPTGGQTGPTGPWLQVSASILPTQDLTYDLGATGLRFRDIYVGGSSIHIGDSVTLSASLDGTLSARNLTGTVSLLSSAGLNGGTLAGIGTTTVSSSGNYYGSNIFSKPFADAPIVVVSSASISNTNTKLIVNPITTTGFKVYSDVNGTAYNWMATAQTDYTFSFYNSVTPLPNPTLGYTTVSFQVNTNSILRGGSPPYTVTLKLDSPSTSKTININTGIQTITFTGLTGNTAYTFKIIAIDNVSNTITSSDQTFTTLQQLSLGTINSPSNDAGAGTVSFSASEAATGGVGPTYTYTIQYKLNGASDSTYANGTSQESYEDIYVYNLTPGIAYTFRIKVVDSATPTGNVAYSTPLEYTTADGLTLRLPEDIISISNSSVKADTFAAGIGTLVLDLTNYTPSAFVLDPGAPPYTVSIYLSYIDQYSNLTTVTTWTPNSLQHTFSGLYPGSYDIHFTVTDSATNPTTVTSLSINQANTIITGPAALYEPAYESGTNTGTVSLKNGTGNIISDSGSGGTITVSIDFSKITGGVPPYTVNLSLYNNNDAAIYPSPAIGPISSGTGNQDITISGITGSTISFSIYWTVADTAVSSTYYNYSQSILTTNSKGEGDGIGNLYIYAILVAPTISIESVTSNSISCQVGIATGGSGMITYQVQYKVTGTDDSTYSSNGSNTTILGLSPSTSYTIRYKATDTVTSNFVYSVIASRQTNALLAPTVELISATSPYGEMMQVSGSCSSDGNDILTALGICYSSTNNPPTKNDTIENVLPGGSYNLPINFNPQFPVSPETYHIRIFATNSVGTAYSDDTLTVTVNELPQD